MQHALMTNSAQNLPLSLCNLALPPHQAVAATDAGLLEDYTAAGSSLGRMRPRVVVHVPPLGSLCGSRSMEMRPECDENRAQWWVPARRPWLWRHAEMRAPNADRFSTKATASCALHDLDVPFPEGCAPGCLGTVHVPQLATDRCTVLINDIPNMDFQIFVLGSERSVGQFASIDLAPRHS